MNAELLPQFNTIDIAAFPARLALILQNNLEEIKLLLRAHKHFSWDNFMRPLEEMEASLEKSWSPFAHLHAVLNTPLMRDCYQQCLTKLSAYEVAIGQNQDIFQAIESIDKNELDSCQLKIIADSLRDFKLSGVALSSASKQRFEEIQAQLSKLCNQFENNVLDAGQNYKLRIKDCTKLRGLPEQDLLKAKALAVEHGFDGWMINLEIPSYIAAISYIDDRDIRLQIYKAYVSRASNLELSVKQYDNTEIMASILALRHEKAELLGFANYAQLSLATKMVNDPAEVMDFLEDLRVRAYPQAQREFSQLQAFALEKYGLTQVEPWDIIYLSEKKKQDDHGVSDEELRLFFPLSKVLEGLFSIIGRLYGMRLERVATADVWHPDVHCYRLSDDRMVRAYIYLDLFARQNKRGGAWMDSLQSRRKLADGSIQLPIATLTCNFSKPVNSDPATLTHDEVLTLFHEFGHGLHHVLTQVDYLAASGIAGVEWDAVELPSQFFEHWAWEEEALGLLTAHIKDASPLPHTSIDKLLAARNFQSAMLMMRQLEFSLFDFRIHNEYCLNTPAFIDKIINEIRANTSVIPVAAFNRFQHSFSHIFGGGYAAGYYSYKWAEVLSSDAFGRFQQEGVFNVNTGRDFLHKILEVGGSRKALESFVDFRGRAAKIDALLIDNGIGDVL